MKKRLHALWGQIGARDLFVFGGIALLTIGAGMVYLPAAPIIAGVVLFSIGLLGIPSWR